MAGSADHLRTKAGCAGQRDKQAGDVIMCTIAAIEHISRVFIRLQLLFLLFLLSAVAFEGEVPGLLGQSIELAQLLFRVAFSGNSLRRRIADGIAVSDKMLGLVIPITTIIAPEGLR